MARGHTGQTVGSSGVSLPFMQGPWPGYPNNMVPTSSRKKPEGKALMMVLRHLLHHKKSIVVLSVFPYVHAPVGSPRPAPSAHLPWCQLSLQTDQLINKKGRTGGGGPGLMERGWETKCRVVSLALNA